MSSPVSTRFCLTALCLGLGAAVRSHAATVELPPPALPGASASATNARPRGPGLPGETSGVARPAPALPGTKSPAAVFRELLRMSPSERAQALADRTEHQRAYLGERLQEYAAFSPEEREARLQELELSYHLPPLMRLTPTNRAERLEFVPVELRPIIDERLRQWDQLPRDTQLSVLQHESTANYFFRARQNKTPRSEPASAFATQPPTPPIAKSRRIADRFNAFVSLPPADQQKALQALTPAEREQMERTLAQFAKMTPEQRKMCVESFEKFNQMNKDERDQFLKNAARWKAMTPGERETWRTLIEILPPSPGAPLLPPAPPGTGASARSPLTASNAPGLPESSR